MRISALTMVVAIFFISTISAGAETIELGYGTHDISKTIQVDDDAAYVIHMKPGDRLVVNLHETGGIMVDFYLTNLTAYMAYQAGLHQPGPTDYLYYLSDYSRKGTIAISYEYTSLITNTLVVLIDNTDYTEDGTTPVGPVTVTGTISVHKNIWTLTNILITVLVVGLIIAFMISVKLPKREKT